MVTRGWGIVADWGFSRHFDLSITESGKLGWSQCLNWPLHYLTKQHREGRDFDHSRLFVSKINSTIKTQQSLFENIYSFRKIYTNFYNLNSFEMISLHIMRDHFEWVKIKCSDPFLVPVVEIALFSCLPSVK